MRSTSISILKSNGYTEIHNGGDWQTLNHKIKKHGTTLLQCRYKLE